MKRSQLSSMWPICATVAGSLLLSACAASPLYVGPRAGVTPGEVARDHNGEPVWSLLPPAPLQTSTPAEALAGKPSGPAKP